ncbi:methyltransferase domain-containing protein [Hellea balneolensis]|uniref:methyltransferase domain-containing protein n=1 Tax=Hellea balneolensis TaxID=287478 RepID=UPI00041D46B9|nr:methyltransferase domain-containing protein [Hellea balneolensis]
MGIISRFFTGSGPSASSPSSLGHSVSDLRQKIYKLETANEKYRARLAERIEMNKTLKNVVDTQKSELNAMRINSRKDLTLERIDTFFTGTKLRLPEEAYQRFLAKCKDNATEDKIKVFREEMDKTQHRAFYEQLFSVEMDMAQGFDFTGLRPIVTFQRGKTDIAYAKSKCMSLDELKANHIQITIERFDEIIKKSFINPKRVNSVCEIGAAWGAATRYMLNRYAPEDYHVYEIDTGWAQWLKDNLGVDSKQCDGESLSETSDNSMDICVASSCLYFMPFVKQWNYLTEFARVLKPGGIAVFNVNLIENTTVRTLKGLLANYFPRRSFGYIPQHCVDTAFPEDKFEKLVKEPAKGFGYQVYRKR